MKISEGKEEKARRKVMPAAGFRLRAVPGEATRAPRGGTQRWSLGWRGVAAGARERSFWIDENILYLVGHVGYVMFAFVKTHQIMHLKTTHFTKCKLRASDGVEHPPGGDEKWVGAYTGAHTYTHTYIDAHMCTHTNTHIHRDMPTYARTHVHVYTLVYTHINVCIYMHMRAHVHTHVHTTHTNRPKGFTKFRRRWRAEVLGLADPTWRGGRARRWHRGWRETGRSELGDRGQPEVLRAHVAAAVGQPRGATWPSYPSFQGKETLGLLGVGGDSLGSGSGDGVLPQSPS